MSLPLQDVDMLNLLQALGGLDDVFAADAAGHQAGLGWAAVTTAPPHTLDAPTAALGEERHSGVLQQPVLGGSAGWAPQIVAPPSAAPSAAHKRQQRQAAAPAPVPSSSKRKHGQGGGGHGGVKEQITELESQLAAKMQELTVLQQQNSKLRDKARMLELVIRARDEQVERLKRLREQLQQLRQQQEHQQQHQAATTVGTAAFPSATGPTAAAATSLATGPDDGAHDTAASTGDHVPTADRTSATLLPKHDAPLADALSNSSSDPIPQQRPSGALTVVTTGSSDSAGGGAGGGALGGGGGEASTKRTPSGSMLEPLESLDAAALQEYTNMPVEQLMGIYHGVIAELTSELVKPPEASRLTQKMANLREFARCMALMSDKLQLMVSRDVTAVQPMPSPSELAAQGGPAAAAPLPPPAASVHSTASSHRLSLGTAAPHLHAAAAAPAPAEGRPPAVPLPDAAALVAATMAVPAIAGSAAGGTTGRISDHVSQTGLPLLGPHEGGGSADLQSPGAQPGSSRTHHSGPLLGLLSGGGGGGGGGLQGSGHLEALGSDGALGGEAGGGGVGVGGAGRLLASGSEAMRAHWANVARALNLSPQQRADTAALSELHGSWVRRVHTERQRLNGMLDQVLRVNKYGRVYQEGLVANSFTEAQLLSRLHRNVQSEHALLMLMGEVFQYQILGLEQAATVLIQSWPLIPDTLAIMAAILDGPSPGAGQTSSA